MSHRYDKSKRDGNQSGIVAEYIALGATVCELAGVGNGCPDLLIGAYGVDQLVEIKRAGLKPRDNQLKWHVEWQGRMVIVQSLVEDCSGVLNAMAWDAGRMTEGGE